MSDFRISRLENKKYSFKDDKILVVQKDENGNYSTVNEKIENLRIKTASNAEIGGIGTGYEQNDYNYPLSLDEEGRAFVYIPWTDYHVQSAWYESSISSLVITFNEGLESLSVSMSSLIDYYYGDGQTITLDEETKKFSVLTENFCTNKNLISSLGGNEGDVIYRIEGKAYRYPVMRFDLYVCENADDRLSVDAHKENGMIRVDVDNKKVYKFSNGGWVDQGINGIENIAKYCGYGRFQYNLITKKLFYADGDDKSIFVRCVRDSRRI